MLQNESIEARIACVLKALPIFLNEVPEKLTKEYLDINSDEAQKEQDQTIIGIYVINHEGADAMDPPAYVGIIIEGVQGLEDPADIPSACALLLGIIYVLNLSHPPDLKCTFKVLQKIVMEMDGASY
ncbi:hypothetical protein AAFF_G00192110 [Aldrovandia affinis]|uniref:Uncharacterized protein n=1 Tax=Aldrovandia affinis TaxID=143900 RepID=A0AAD7RJG4_9TELE|nr:hypothetical protein AAFF_G00192110 [Aldrovandia affinis]